VIDTQHCQNLCANTKKCLYGVIKPAGKKKQNCSRILANCVINIL
jgi:hypothetical protein